MSKKYRITAPSGKVREDLTYQDVLNFKNAKMNAGKSLEGFSVEEYDDGASEPSKSSPVTKNSHQERQQKYGTLGSMFPYLADDYDRNGSVSTLEGAIRRGVAGVKDVASYPGRAAAGLIDYAVNGDYSLGKTSEEAFAKGQSFGGILRDPYSLIMAKPVGNGTRLVKAAKEAALGASVGALESSTRQEGYGMSPLVGAGIGAGAGLLGILPSALASAMRSRIRNIDSMTKEELNALANASLRGPGSKPLNDIEIAQLIESQPEVIDIIARTANRRDLSTLQNEAARKLENFGMTPIKETAMGTKVGRNEYLSRGKMGKTMTPKESIFAEQSRTVRDRLKAAKAEGAPKAIVAEDTQELARLQSEQKAARGKREMNYSEGVDQLRQTPSRTSQKAVTDEKTAKFFDDLNMLMDDAVTKMSATWRTEGGRLRRNARGQIIPETPEQIGNRANDYINMLSDKVQGRARSKERGLNESDARITNEDISVVLRKMAAGNEFEFMDALLNACTWLDDATKQSLKRYAMVEKAAGNAQSFMGTKMQYLDEDGNIVGNLVGRTPVGRTVKFAKEIALPSDKGFPRNFSKRYTEMQDGTRTRRFLDAIEWNNPPQLFTPTVFGFVPMEREDRR